MLTTYLSIVSLAAVLMTIGLVLPAMVLAVVAASIVLRHELLLVARSFPRIRAARVSAPAIERVKG